MDKSVILERVLASPRLPSLPTIALEVIDLVQQRDVNIKQIANTIQHDPALSTKILKTVNSSFYGQAHSISTISHALVILGLNSVKTLALGFSLVNNLQNAGGEAFDHLRFWRRSLYSAVATKTLARQLGMLQQEEAFLCGLLQDLGMLALAQTLGSEYSNIVLTAGEQHAALSEQELDVLGFDHAEVGGILAESWRLPPLLVTPIRFHEKPDEAPEELRSLVRCAALGSHVADVFMSEGPGEALDAYYRLGESWFNLSRDQAEPLLKTIHAGTVEMNRLLDMPDESFDDPDVILGQANEALLELSLRQQQQADELAHRTTELQRQQEELEAQNRQLFEQATRDSLTGAANRRRFNEFIAQGFEHTAKSGQPMTILFLDTDHFKKFNDTYGHQVGDRVLVILARVLMGSAPEDALVARYGGEEFAIVMPDVDRISGARFAEKIRRIIESTTVESDDGEELSITASIGVATYEGDFFKRVEQVVKAADQAVYAAKSAGRNCVRVFTPRPAANAPKPTSKVA